MSNSKNITYPTNNDGSKNDKYIDLLDEDKPIAGQAFCCISFISPEQIIKQKEMFYMDEFIKDWDLSKSFEKFNHFLNFISYKYSLSFEDLTQDMNSFITTEKDEMRKTNLLDDYKNFLDKNETNLENSFNALNHFKTSVRGIKIRGGFPSQPEAETRAKMLRESDPNHDVYVGPVGMWMPFHPEAYKTGRVEYLETELNQLMHEKTNNEARAKEDFDNRVKEARVKAMEDNKTKALASGNKLTQVLNTDGNLVNIRNINLDDDSDEEKNSPEPLVNIQKELFSDDNIPTSIFNINSKEE
jgi:hypothetical protein